MFVLVIAFGFGIVSGLRSMMGLAAISVATRAGLLTLRGTWLAFLGYAWAPWLLVAAALAELVNDKLPKTPSRKSPPQFVARVMTGGLCGLAVGLSTGELFWTLCCGVAGAVVGTYAGAAARNALDKVVGGRDLPIALAEDATALILVTVFTLCL